MIHESMNVYMSPALRTEVVIYLTLEDARSTLAPGENGDNIRSLAKKRYIAEQLHTLPANSLRNELLGYGAWTREDLEDHDENLIRWLWLAGTNITEEENQS